MHLQENATAAYEEGLITAAEYAVIQEKYTVDFYKPNFFIQLGLFFLTLVIAGFSIGVFSLFLMSSIERNFQFVLILQAIIAYIMLHKFVQQKHHFGSGIDNALMWISGASIISALNLLTLFSSVMNALLITLVAAFFAIRFLEVIMACIATVSLYVWIYLLAVDLFHLPFLIIIIMLIVQSIILFAIADSYSKKIHFLYYKNSLQAVSIIALLGAYIFGNYLILKEFGLPLAGFSQNNPLPWSWLFWVYTISVPVIYIIRGLQLKHAILLRVGLLLIAVMMFTVRFYNTSLSIEMWLMISGFLLITISYVSIRYLAISRNGYTSNPLRINKEMEKHQLEALLISETLSSQTTVSNKFGGGDFGGGGASGDF